MAGNPLPRTRMAQLVSPQHIHVQVKSVTTTFILSLLTCVHRVPEEAVSGHLEADDACHHSA